MKNFHSNRGYTLIELMVSVAIFAIIMLLATGAYFSLLSYTRQARATSVVMTNLSFAMDSMTREIRTGSHYSCDTSDSGSNDCTSGGTAFSFKSADLDADGNPEYITYLLSGTSIARCILRNHTSICTTSIAIPITDPAVNVSSLKFYVRGASASDTSQPIASIIVKGATDVAHAQPVTFSIQGTATQRLLDL